MICIMITSANGSLFKKLLQDSGFQSFNVNFKLLVLCLSLCVGTLYTFFKNKILGQIN